MKNLITTVASLMLLLAFLLQFTANQVLHSRLCRIDNEVSYFQNEVRQEGYVTSQNIQDVKQNIAKIMDCNESEIIVVGDLNEVKKGKLINYSITVPLKDIIGCSEFWNFEEKLEYKITRKTTSEVVDRSKNW